MADTAPYNQSSSMRPDQRGNPLSDLDLISNKQVFGLFVGLSERQKVKELAVLTSKRIFIDWLRAKLKGRGD